MKEYSESIKTIINKYEKIWLIRRDGNFFIEYSYIDYLKKFHYQKNENLYNHIKK